MDLESYPFAIVGSSLIMTMGDKSKYVFEAQDDERAIQIIKGLRNLLARLSYNLIAGNALNVCSELLNTTNNMKLTFSRSNSSLENEQHFSRSKYLTDGFTDQLIEKSLQNLGI